jgi:transposase-like protein
MVESYSERLHRHAVSLVLEQGKSINEAARFLDVTPRSLKLWLDSHLERTRQASEHEASSSVADTSPSVVSKPHSATAPVSPPASKKKIFTKIRVKNQSSSCVICDIIYHACMVYDVDSLPDDIAQLKAIIVTLSQSNAKQQETLDQLVAVMSRQTVSIQQLLEIIYGKMSEKTRSQTRLLRRNKAVDHMRVASSTMRSKCNPMPKRS